MKKVIFVIVGFIFMNKGYALGLVDAYQDAVRNDPTYKQAEGTFIANKEVLPQARAALLPRLEIAARSSKNWGSLNNDIGSKLKANKLDYRYELRASQSLFNWSHFASLRAARAAVNQAAAIFVAAGQDLMYRTAQAYFAVLKAEEILDYTQINKTALASQLNVVKHRWQVGLDPVSLVYQSQAEYDLANVDYLTNKMELSEKQEALALITDKIYPTLNCLQGDFPLLLPSPADLNVWTQAAVAKNFTLRAARFGMLAAQDTVRAKEGEYAPKLNLTSSYGAHRGAIPNGTKAMQTNTSATVGLEANFNLYNGGLTTSRLRQAQGQYQVATMLMENAYREAVKSARIAYLKVSVGVSRIEADRLSIKSSLSALNSTKVGYKVGTRTLTEVLKQQQKLYKAQTKYAQHRFDYLLTTLELKQVTGSLSVEDLYAIDKWLSAKQHSALITASDTILTAVAEKSIPKNSIKQKLSSPQTKQLN